MRARVQRWGDDLALRIPKPVAEMTELEDGAEVDLSLENGRLVIAPMNDEHYTLEDLVSQITDENRHGEVDPGPPVGKEVW